MKLGFGIVSNIERKQRTQKGGVRRLASSSLQFTNKTKQNKTKGKKVDTIEKFLKKYANQRIFRARNGNKMSLRVAKNGLSVRIDAPDAPPITTHVVEKEEFTRIVPDVNCVISNFKTKFAFILNQRVKNVDFHEEKIHIETNSTVSAISYNYVSKFRDFRLDNVSALREIISLADPLTDCFVKFSTPSVDFFWVNGDGTKIRVSSEATQIPKYFKYFYLEPPAQIARHLQYGQSKPVLAYLSVLSAHRCAEVRVDLSTLSAVFFDSLITLSIPDHIMIGNSFTNTQII